MSSFLEKAHVFVQAIYKFFLKRFLLLNKLCLVKTEGRNRRKYSIKTSAPPRHNTFNLAVWNSETWYHVVKMQCPTEDLPFWPKRLGPASPAHHTYHTSFVSLHELNDLARGLLPEEDVPAVTTAHHKLTLGAIEIDAFYWKDKRGKKPHKGWHRAYIYLPHWELSNLQTESAECQIILFIHFYKINQESMCVIVPQTIFQRDLSGVFCPWATVCFNDTLSGIGLKLMPYLSQPDSFQLFPLLGPRIILGIPSQCFLGHQLIWD